MSSIEITTQQYRQIDFLRLFRLCRNLNIINKKRKMPINYSSGDLDKDDRNSRSASRRLLREVIKYSFKDYPISSSSTTYYITIPKQINDNLTWFINNYYRIERIQEASNLVNAYRNITNFRNRNIGLGLPQNISIYLAYGNVNRRDYLYKPNKSFYEIAKNCLAFKAVWDENIEIINDDKSINTIKCVIERPQENRENREVERRLREQDRNTNRQNPQTLFNRALNNLRRQSEF